jgi:hypothetical protein
MLAPPAPDGTTRARSWPKARSPTRARRPARRGRSGVHRRSRGPGNGGARRSPRAPFCASAHPLPTSPPPPSGPPSLRPAAARLQDRVLRRRVQAARAAQVPSGHDRPPAAGLCGHEHAGRAAGRPGPAPPPAGPAPPGPDGGHGRRRQHVRRSRRRRRAHARPRPRPHARAVGAPAQEGADRVRPGHQLRDQDQDALRQAARDVQAVPGDPAHVPKGAEDHQGGLRAGETSSAAAAAAASPLPPPVSPPAPRSRAPFTPPSCD